MPMRLGSVRAKFSLLVGLPVVLVLAVFPFISKSMERQLSRQADERIDEAREAFQEELDDATSDLLLTVRVLSENAEARRGLATHDPTAAQTAAHHFIEIYPHHDILFLLRAATILPKLG